MNNSPRVEIKDFPVGRVIADRYEILEHIGQGGMGFVLKAKDLTLDNEIVVLKILYPQLVKNKTVFARFRREVLLTRRLSHPNIVKIYDFGEAGSDTFFISMEFVSGESLEAKLKKVAPNGLPFQDVLNYLHQVAMGLAYAHSQGIVHRDIKPGNILISATSEVKISDFGVARSIESKEQLTRTNEAIGSPLYMSPEQLNAQTIDHRSDIYGLGIMAFELATGKPPFDSEHWLMLVKMHLSDPIPDFASKKSGIPLWFQDLVSKACAKEPAKRFPSALDFGVMIERFSKTNLSESPGSMAFSGMSRAPRESSSLVAALVVLLLISLVGAGGYFLFTRLPDFLHNL